MINLDALFLTYQIIIFSCFFALGVVIGMIITSREKKRMIQKDTIIITPKPNNKTNSKTTTKTNSKTTTKTNSKTTTKEEKIIIPRKIEEW